MANGKKIKRPKETKIWKALTGKLEKKTRHQKDAEHLIQTIQQDLMWDDRDLETYTKIQKGIIDWSGDVRSKRRTGKHIRKRG
jgi:hypothetical protein